MAEFHKHVIATVYLDKELDVSYTDFVEDWFKRLVDAIGMNILIPPKCVWSDNPGNEGVTGITCIDTSHSSMHAWGAPYNFIKVDLYSCKYFSTETYLEFLKEFNPNKISYSVIDRLDDENPLIETSSWVR